MTWQAQLSARWRLLIVLTILALGLLALLGPDYVELQNSSDADEFRRILPNGEQLRYVVAVLADIAFAALYGAVALAITPQFVICRVGAWLVVAAAALDELENFFMFSGVVNPSRLTDVRVDAMRVAGLFKWACLGAGVAVFLLGLLIFAVLALSALLLWLPTPILGWVRSSWVPYTTLLACLLFAAVFAAQRLPSIAAVFLVGIAASSIWLNQRVRSDRSGATSHGAERTLLAAVLLVLGSGLIYVGIRYPERLDVLFFFGLVFVLISAGSLVSELRQTTWLRLARGPLLVVGAVTALVAATAVEGWTAFLVGAAALVVGMIGVELASQDYQDVENPPSPWVVSGGGVLLLLTGIALAVTAGVDPAHALLLVGVLAVLVFMASVDGDALAVIVVITLALAWAYAPAEASPDELLVAQHHPGEPYFLVLGDSYISGEGAERFIEGTNKKVKDAGADSDRLDACRQAPTAWPFLVAEMAAASGDSTIPSRVLFLGCSGALTENIHTLDRKDEEGEIHGPALLKLYEEFESGSEPGGSPLGPPEFVVVSIGGNDAGFGELVRACIAPGSCAEVGQQFLTGRVGPDQPLTGEPGAGPPESLDSIGDDLSVAYQRIRSAVGDDVPIIAVAYPKPTTEGGRCSSALLDDAERRFVNAFAKALNSKIEDVARDNEVLFMGSMQDSLGGGAQLCSTDSGPAGLNFLALNPTAGTMVDRLTPTNWTHNSMHPNAGGHEAMAAVAWEWLHDCLPDDTPDECREMPTNGDDDTVEGVALPTQCDPEVRPSCTINGNTWVIERVEEAFATALFPTIVLLAGLWLAMAPFLRWRHQSFQDGEDWPVVRPIWDWLS